MTLNDSWGSTTLGTRPGGGSAPQPSAEAYARNMYADSFRPGGEHTRNPLRKAYADPQFPHRVSAHEPFAESSADSFRLEGRRINHLRKHMLTASGMRVSGRGGGKHMLTVSSMRVSGCLRVLLRNSLHARA